MPMYEYACDDCGLRFERVQSFHDQPLTACPECAGSVHRLISSVGIIFKGSGWYITDSRRQIGSTAPAKDKNGGESASAGAADTAVADSAPVDGAKPEPAATESNSKKDQKEKSAKPATESTS